MFSFTVKLAFPVPDTWHPGTAQLVLMMVDIAPDKVAELSIQIPSSGLRSSSFSLLQARMKEIAIPNIMYFNAFIISTVSYVVYYIAKRAKRYCSFPREDTVVASDAPQKKAPCNNKSQSYCGLLLPILPCAIKVDIAVGLRCTLT